MAESDLVGLVQPDQRSCGAAVLVAAELLRTPSYAALASTPGGFRTEVLSMHRRVTSAHDVSGRLQLPWPQALGTPPWAIARQLTGTTGVRPRGPGRARSGATRSTVSPSGTTRCPSTSAAAGSPATWCS